MGVTEGVLTLLRAGPCHGYGLKVAFEAATGGVWDLNVGQVYGVLQRMEKHGLVAPDGEDDGRKRYRITADGEARVARWLLNETIHHGTGVRDELVMKILVARAAGNGVSDVVITRQRAATMQALQALTRQKAAGALDLEAFVHLDRLILRCRAELDWLDLVEERLNSAPEARTGDTHA